jgi:CHAT domain-containing protein
LQVTRERLNAELAQKPMVLHFALHAVPAGNSGESSVHLALGMAPDGKMDFLTPAEISRLRNPVPIVVMSGCSSGRGQALPGAGLTGLTRAWLLAGSRAVTASHWQTADDDGAMFVSFYRSFVSSSKNISSRACADALRAAQVEMMRSRSARAQPKYWAAFFVMGRD